MRRTTFLLAAILSFTPASALAGRAPQRLAPVVGRWRVDLTIEADRRTLEFETDDEGNYGLGKGYVIVLPVEDRSREYPAAWCNINPQQIRITAEIDFRSKTKPQRGTLTLRTTLAPGEAIKGDALFIDEALTVHRGTFTMTRIPESDSLREKIK